MDQMETKIRKKTYQQYREQIKPDIYAEAGEIIKCQGGHLMGTFACTTYVDDNLTDFDVVMSTESQWISLDPKRCSCGNTFIMTTKRPYALKYSTCIRFWIDGEWRIRKYEKGNDKL